MGYPTHDEQHCPISGQEQILEYNNVEIPILGKPTPGIKTTLESCNDEDCINNGTVNCHFFNK